MADSKISDLTAATSVSATADYCVIVQSGANKKALAGLIRPSWRGCIVRKSANQSIASAGSGTLLTWDTEDADTDTIHDNSSNTTRLTVPSGVTRVRVTAAARWANQTGGVRQLTMYKNGASFAGRGGIGVVAQGTGTVIYDLNITSAPIAVTAGDYFEILAYQDSGSAVNVLTHDNTWASLEIVE